MKVEVIKIWNGFTSVRDYTVKQCIKTGQDLVITHKGDSMRVPFERLKNPLNLVKTPMKSKFNGKEYCLYDFRWNPDRKIEEKSETLSLF